MSNPIKILGYKITSSITKGSRSVKTGYVEKTDVWTRAFISDTTQSDFNDVVQDNMETLDADAHTVALQETPHQSKKDQRTHWTAVELNISGKVLKKRHFPVK